MLDYRYLEPSVGQGLRGLETEQPPADDHSLPLPAREHAYLKDIRNIPVCEYLPGVDPFYRRHERRCPGRKQDPVKILPAVLLGL